jgi:hypothetical protein
MHRKRFLAACAAIAALTDPAEAHHSRAMFDTSRAEMLTGEVRRFQWNNPHCYIQLRVTDAQGQQREYSIEMGAPMHLQGRGWTPRTLKPGDQVRVTIYPLRNGDAGGELASITTMDGRELGRTR